MDQTLELLLSRIEDQRKTVLNNLGDGAEIGRAHV
jgi:hypothetical protein